VPGVEQWRLGQGVRGDADGLTVPPQRVDLCTQAAAGEIDRDAGTESVGTLCVVAFDEGLAERVRALLANEPDSHERKMFGGLCFLCSGNMACGIVGDELMVRVGPDAWTDALRQPHAREMDFTGRSMKGMVSVGVDGFTEDADLVTWVRRGATYARSLPPK